MEALGAISAVTSLFCELEACGKSLHRFSRDIRMAKKEVKLLKYEIQNCQVLASIFGEAISSVGNRVMQMAREKKLDQRLRDQSKLAHDQILEITRKLRPLSRGKKSNGFQKFRAKVRWHFTKDDLHLPMAALASVKASLNLLTTLSLLDSAIAALSKIPASNNTTEAQLLAQIKSLKKQARRTDRALSNSVRELLEQSHAGQADSVGNIKVIKVIIQQIEKGTIKEAQALIERASFGEPRATRTSPPPRNNSSEIYISSSFPPTRDTWERVHIYASNTRHENAPHMADELPTDRRTRSPSFIRNGSSAHDQEDIPLVGTPILPGEAHETPATYLDHEDSSRMEHEQEDPDLPAPNDMGHDSSHVSGPPRSIYQPMPPFDNADLRGRKKRIGNERKD